MFGSLHNNISESPETQLVPISIREISMLKIESRDISNRKYLSKTILACRERQAKNQLSRNHGTGRVLTIVHEYDIFTYKVQIRSAHTYTKM